MSHLWPAGPVLASPVPKTSIKTYGCLWCQMKVYLMSKRKMFFSDKCRQSTTVAKCSSLLFPYCAVRPPVHIQTHTGERKWIFVLASNVSGRKLAMCYNNSTSKCCSNVQSCFSGGESRGVFEGKLETRPVLSSHQPGSKVKHFLKPILPPAEQNPCLINYNNLRFLLPLLYKFCIYIFI